MADITKITVESGTYNIKDAKLNTQINNVFTNSNNKYAFIGDSIGEGYGWWGGVLANKTTSNDGFCALLRAEYGITITNYCKSGSTIANIPNHLSLISQVQSVPSDTTHCFILSGINDVTVSVADNTNYIGYPMDKLLQAQFISNTYNNTCNALESCINALLSKNANMKIYYIIDPTYDYVNYYLYDMAFCMLKFICEKYGVNVIDLRKNFRKYLQANSSQYFLDKVHPNENGYRLMYPYFRNHVIFDINDNFKETPPCILVDTDINFGGTYTNVMTMVENLAKEIGQKCPLWQQTFETMAISSISLGNPNTKVAHVTYTWNAQSGKIEIDSIHNAYNFKYTCYVTSDKYSNSTFSPTCISTANYLTFSEGMTNNMNITTIKQLNRPGVYQIPYNKLAQITDLCSDLKSSEHGWAICEVLSYSDNFMIQRWYSLYLRAYIYMAYVNDATTNPVVTWKKVGLENF